jgi:mannose/fructose/N-acetylgalactosamine-specific phosphotransferase system component IIC
VSAAAAAAGAAGIAALELDAASIGTLLLSRPFVVGPLVGWARGDVWSGAALGAVFEAVTLFELPLGGCLDMSASVAAGVAAWLACGVPGVPLEAAFLAGIAAGALHARAESRLRRARGVLARRAEAATLAGEPAGLGAKLASAVAVQAAATFAVCLLFLAVAAAVLPPLWVRLPSFAAVGARAAFLSAPWIGAGGLVASLGRRA